MNWWERYPDRLKIELDAFQSAGMIAERDEKSIARGVFRINTRLRLSDEEFPLVVTYPDLYPYFRVEVQAPTLSLAHHQNPFLKNLCLIGRSTFNWDVDDTAAGLLQQQFDSVLTAGRSEAAPAAGVEQRQAEPTAEYLPFSFPSIFCVDGSWQIDRSERSGFLRIKLYDDASPNLRGIVIDVQTNSGLSLAKAPNSIRDVFRGPTVTARWVRSDASLTEADPQHFFHAIERLDLGRQNNKPIQLAGGVAHLWGVLFSDEMEYRVRGENWIFICHIGKRLKDISK